MATSKVAGALRVTRMHPITKLALVACCARDGAFTPSELSVDMGLGRGGVGQAQSACRNLLRRKYLLKGDVGGTYVFASSSLPSAAPPKKAKEPTKAPAARVATPKKAKERTDG